MSEQKKCPCHSGKIYEECCSPFHQGTKVPENAELLMRSRYSAYALGLYEYLLKTTHPDNPNYPVDLPSWMKEVKKFKENTLFENLEIHQSETQETKALVTFTAFLKQKGKDASFTEQSLFEKKEGRWLYKDGIYVC